MSGEISESIRAAELLDACGSALSDEAQETMRLYYEEDLSLSELAELYGITPQGVRDRLVKSMKKLEALDAELKLTARRKLASELYELLRRDAPDSEAARLAKRLIEL